MENWCSVKKETVGFANDNDKYNFRYIFQCSTASGSTLFVAPLYNYMKIPSKWAIFYEMLKLDFNIA